MRRILSSLSCRVAVAVAGVVAVVSTVVAYDEAAPIPLRKPWNTSQIKGSPEPPLPYRARRVYPHLGFKNPTVLSSAPGTERLFVAEQSGKIYSIPDDPDCRQGDLFLDVSELIDQINARRDEDRHVAFAAVYGMTFHPDFVSNRKCYVCYVVRGKKGPPQLPDGTRVVELTVGDSDPPQAIVDSERVVITWLQGGHNGGCIKFGLDGMLYVSTGDGGFAFPPDGRNSGQDVSTLLSAVLRIDVDHPTGDRAYSIPRDNPFVARKGARGEIWAYGMRNPWKISFDRQTGDLWVGDVGWELWELVYRVKPGDNYGWSLMEGRQPVHTERERGPTPIVPPAVEIPHTEGASITGGFVYRGQRLPELDGHYIFGDWETRRFWGVPVDGDKIGPRKELVEPTVRIVGFAERNDGELLLLDYDDGSIHELVRSPTQTNDTPFPTKLSETGLFASVPDHEPAAGIVPFSINAAQWADHATADRWLGLPGDESITLHDNPSRIAGSMFSRAMDYPQDAVLMKTLSLDVVHGDPATRRKVETQVLHFNGYDWRGYSYRWNDAQTDAALVDAAGATATIDIVDRTAPGGRRRQSWRFASRTECIRCHNPWAEFSLAFNVSQLNRPDEQTGLNQLDKLYRLGVLRDPSPDVHPEDKFAVLPERLPSEQRPALSDPLDESIGLGRRARSYLHVNCAHCHRFNGGGSARINIPFDQSIYKTEALGTRPTQGTFGIHDAMIVAPSDPLRSVLYFRMAKAGPGHMPHLGSRIVDRQGLSLIYDWIQQLPAEIAIAEQLDRLVELNEAAVLVQEQRDAARTRWNLAKRIAQDDQRDFPVQSDMEAAAERAKNEAAGRVASRQQQRVELIAKLLADPRGAIALARARGNGRLSPATGRLAVNAAAAHDNLAVRDLFEMFLPDDRRTERLGDTIDVEKLLAISGDATRGRDLFLNAKGMQCRSCHRVGDQGKPLGPDLTGIGKKLSREKLLESLLEPSKTIDPKFAAWLIETDAGKVISGLLVKKTVDEVVIRDTQNVEHTLEIDEIDGMYPQRKSLMPDRMLRDLTAQQAADLLAWLASLREPNAEPQKDEQPKQP